MSNPNRLSRFVSRNLVMSSLFFGSLIGALASEGIGTGPPVDPSFVAPRGLESLGGVLGSLAGCCGLLAPWLLHAPLPIFLAWLLLWGVTVAGDSPQFSALTAANAPPQAVGSVLTLSNSIGFAISVVSIELFVRLAQTLPLGQLLPWLALGPALGLLAMRPLRENR